MLSLNIVIKTVNGLPQYFVTLNDVIISRVYFTEKDAEACLVRNLKKLKDVCIDGRVVI